MPTTTNYFSFLLVVLSFNFNFNFNFSSICWVEHDMNYLKLIERTLHRKMEPFCTNKHRYGH